MNLLLILSVTNQYHTYQVDVVLACLQAPIEHDLYLKLPKGIETKKWNRRMHMLKLINNIYGQNQAEQVWNKYLSDKLLTIGSKQSAID